MLGGDLILTLRRVESGAARYISNGIEILILRGKQHFNSQHREGIEQVAQSLLPKSCFLIAKIAECFTHLVLPSLGSRRMAWHFDVLSGS